MTSSVLTKKLNILTNWDYETDGYTFDFLLTKMPSFGLIKEESGALTLEVEAPYFFDGTIRHMKGCVDGDCVCVDLTPIEVTNVCDGMIVAIIELMEKGVNFDEQNPSKSTE